MHANGGNRGVDVAIEAVGTPETWQLAARMVRRGGVVNFFGGCPSDSAVALDTSLLHYSEITCKASFHHTPAYIQKALQSVSRGDITALDFVNREEPLKSLLEVFRGMTMELEELVRMDQEEKDHRADEEAEHGVHWLDSLLVRVLRDDPVPRSAASNDPIDEPEC